MPFYWNDIDYDVELEGQLKNGYSVVRKLFMEFRTIQNVSIHSNRYGFLQTMCVCMYNFRTFRGTLLKSTHHVRL